MFDLQLGLRLLCNVWRDELTKTTFAENGGDGELSLFESSHDASGVL